MTSRIAWPGEGPPNNYEYGGYKVGVGGGRDFDDDTWLVSVLDQFHKTFYINELITGGAKGADALSETWAKVRQIAKITIFPAQWDLYGKAAGMHRNKLVVESCEIFMAFPTENSVGTYGAIQEALLNNKYVYVFGPDKKSFKKYIPG